MGKHVQFSDRANNFFVVPSGHYFLLSKDIGGGYVAAAISSNASNSQNRGKCTPFWIRDTITIDRLAIYCPALNAGVGAVIRLGIYNDNGSGRPGTVLVDGGGQDITSTGVKEATISNTVLAPGFYWAVGVTQNLDTAGANPTFASTSSGGLSASETTLQVSNNMMTQVDVTGVTGALADNPTVTLTRNTSPIRLHIWARVV